ncbi:MAG: prepilin peptidase [Elusimicrobia bacterium]|nr:prepilin peptidase [Elusimicrobiota bacterium]
MISNALPDPAAAAAFETAAWTFWALLGLCLGSFANVVIHRLPRGRSLVRPRSHCPRCRATIAFYDNIPVLSWVLLRGRCRSCGKAVSWRYPLVELLSGALACAVWWRWHGQWAWAGAAFAAVLALLCVAFIDCDTFLIPDELSLGLVGAGLLLSPLNPGLGSAAGTRVAAALVGGLFGLGLCWGVAALGEWMFKREAMGVGDIKLLAGVGAWTGVLGAFDTLVAASFAGAAYGVYLIARGRLRRQDPIPFGPFLSAGAILTLFYRLPFGFPFLSR